MATKKKRASAKVKTLRTKNLTSKHAKNVKGGYIYKTWKLNS